jgi:hypothetical protein
MPVGKLYTFSMDVIVTLTSGLALGFRAIRVIILFGLSFLISVAYPLIIYFYFFDYLYSLLLIILTLIFLFCSNWRSITQLLLKNDKQ